jgi:hypothetical protein
MVARRRQSSQKRVRDRAAERGRAKRSAALERRIEEFGSLLNQLQKKVESQFKLTTAIQAQVDHIDAKVRGN